MHVIVGQGQLDSILHATPEDRRGFIEEAAGVLKHRKRKEKALRKLDASEGNLTRLGDLLGEIRRQLKPLGRQAEVARRAAGVQADVRDARARLLADDLVTARTALEQELADESLLRRARAPRSRRRPPRRSARRPSSRRRCARTCRRWRGPRRPGSRCPACASGCAAPSPSPPSGSATPRGRRRPRCARGPRPRELEAEAAGVRDAGGRDRRRGRGAPGRARAGGRDRATAAEDAAAEEERRVAGPARAPPPTAARAWPGCTARSTRCGRARARPRTRSAGSATAREEAAGPGRPRAAGLHRARDPVAGPRRRRGGPRRRARGRRRAARRPRRAARQGARGGPARRARPRRRWRARKEALELGLRRKDGAGALLAATDRVSGLLGSVAALLTVRTGLRGRRRARARHRRRRGGRRPTPTPRSPRSATSRTDDLGRAGLLLGGADASATTGPWPALPAGGVVRRRRGRVPRRAAAARWPGCSTGSPSSTTSRPRAALVARAARRSPRSPGTATCSARTSPPAARDASRA